MAAMVQQHGQWVAFKVQVLVILVLIDFGFDHSILLRTGWVLSLTYTCDDILHVVWLRSVALWNDWVGCMPSESHAFEQLVTEDCQELVFSRSVGTRLKA